MSMLSSLVSPSTTTAPPLPDMAGLATGIAGPRPDGPVAAVERAGAARDSVHGRPQRPDPREGRQRGARPGLPATPAASRPRPGHDVADVSGASAHFLAQVLSQDLGPPTRPIAAHRDAPVLGSEAYRRAGGTPPIYSEQPTVFRITV